MNIKFKIVCDQTNAEHSETYEFGVSHPRYGLHNFMASSTILSLQKLSFTVNIKIVDAEIENDEINLSNHVYEPLEIDKILSIFCDAVSVPDCDLIQMQQQIQEAKDQNNSLRMQLKQQKDSFVEREAMMEPRLDSLSINIEKNNEMMMEIQKIYKH